MITYPYDLYLEAGAKGGTALAKRVGVATQLNIARQAGEFPKLAGHGAVPLPSDEQLANGVYFGRFYVMVETDDWGRKYWYVHEVVEEDLPFFAWLFGVTPSVLWEPVISFKDQIAVQ